MLITAVKITVGAGKRINDLAPASKKFLNFQKLEQYIPQIESALKELEPLLDEVPSVLDKLGLGRQAALRNSIRRSPLASTVQRLRDRSFGAPGRLQEEGLAASD
ncbi:MAG: hypothetical protein IPF60_07425 [Betaproteobacteria bacterium]|nr:hypothetical protein [Betaproteobacteria bacterium]